MRPQVQITSWGSFYRLDNEKYWDAFDQLGIEYVINSFALYEVMDKRKFLLGIIKYGIKIKQVEP
jgi:hypothetical protein